MVGTICVGKIDKHVSNSRSTCRYVPLVIEKRVPCLSPGSISSHRTYDMAVVRIYVTAASILHLAPLKRVHSPPSAPPAPLLSPPLQTNKRSLAIKPPQSPPVPVEPCIAPHLDIAPIIRIIIITTILALFKSCSPLPYAGELLGSFLEWKKKHQRDVPCQLTTHLTSRPFLPVPFYKLVGQQLLTA